jgi:DNA-binding NtrC family response regulator
LCGDAGQLEPEHLGISPQSAAPPPLSVPDAAGSAPAAAPGASALSADLSLAELEKRYILTVMEKNPSRTQAARLLGISIRTLRNKLNEYGVHNKDDTTEFVKEEGEAQG